MGGIEGVVGCKGCGKPIKFIKSATSEKMIPVNAETTTIATTEGKVIKGHIPHHITCPKADQFHPETEKKKETPNPEGSEKQDRCERCDSKTSYRKWSPPDSPDVLEFWDCIEGCGRWWTREDSGFAPVWKDATPEQIEKARERLANER